MYVCLRVITFSDHPVAAVRAGLQVPAQMRTFPSLSPSELDSGYFCASIGDQRRSAQDSGCLWPSVLLTGDHSPEDLLGADMEMFL